MKEPIECLIIDDDKDDQEIFMMCIDKLDTDIQCNAADDAIQALSILSNTEYVPDFIFVDMNMPKMNGIECLKALNKMDRLKNSKIYMYSTTMEPSVLEEAIELGAADFIVKPVKTADLRDKMNKIFGLD